MRERDREGDRERKRKSEIKRDIKKILRVGWLCAPLPPLVLNVFSSQYIQHFQVSTSFVVGAEIKSLFAKSVRRGYCCFC